MDTDINNYKIDEIFSIVKVKKDCNLEQLCDTIKCIMNKLDQSNKNNVYEYKHFFRECFKKIVFKQGFNVPEYIYKELGIIKVNNKLPEIDNVDNTSSGNIVERKNYPGAVPEIITQDTCSNTTITQYPRGLVNPIKRESVKNLLVINSKFRDNKSQSSTDFSVELNETYHNVVSIKLASLEFMNSYYTFSTYLKTNEFTIKIFEYNTSTYAITNGPFTHNIVFPEGNYTTFEIAARLNAIFNLNEGGSYTDVIEVINNSSKGKIIFRVKAPGTLPFPPSLPPSDSLGVNNHAWGFDLDFEVFGDCYSREIYNNFGWLMGFRDNKYTFFKDYKQNGTLTFSIGYNPEAFTNVLGTPFYLLEVTDYNKNVSEVLKYNTSNIYNFNIHDIIAKVPNVAGQLDVIFEDSSDRIFKSRHYFGPVKISKLHIRMIDENGIVLNLNNGDINYSFEIEQLDAPYQNMVK